MGKDWKKSQRDDNDISFIVDHLIEGHKPSSSEADASKIDKRMIADWAKYHLKDGVLYKTITLSDEEFDLICLLHSLVDLGNFSMIKKEDSSLRGLKILSSNAHRHVVAA